MFDRAFIVLCGILGSCTAIGVPITVQESNRLTSLWGEDGASASQVSFLSGGAENLTLNNTLRRKICNELGLDWSTHVNDDSSFSSSGAGRYICHGNGGTTKNMDEEIKPKYYQGSVDTNSGKSVIRCLRENRPDGQNSGVNGSQCKKK